MNKMLTSSELAEHLRIHVKTLERWRRIKKGPPYIRDSRGLILYRVEDVAKWEQSRLVSHSETEHGNN